MDERLKDKILCEAHPCGWHGLRGELLRAPNPFAFEEGEELVACPRCRDTEALRVACDETDCWTAASCGTPTPSGYRVTCGEHAPSPPEPATNAPAGRTRRTPAGVALRQALVRLRLIEERVSHVLPADLQQELAASIQGVTDQVRGRGPTGGAHLQPAAVADILAALATALRDAAP